MSLATAARIGFVTNQFRRVKAGPNATVVANYGALARDTGTEPIATHFASTADALVFANERLTLQARNARRLTATIESSAKVAGDEFGLDMIENAEIPTLAVNDTERLLVANPMLLAGISIDFGGEKSIAQVWG